jgi:hypothetical protein
LRPFFAGQDGGRSSAASGCPPSSEARGASAGDRAQAAALAAAHGRREMRELIAMRVSTDDPHRGVQPAGGVLETATAAVEAMFTAIATVPAEVLRLHETAERDGRLLERADLAPLHTLLAAKLEEIPIMAGLGMIFAPHTLGDEERWIEWLCAGEDGPPEALVTTLDPSAPDFYDYEAAEWYEEPRVHGTRWIAGPFVDHSGTDAHIFTLTEPVLDAHGRFLGVAGADLTVDSVETITRPALAAVPAPAILLNHRGRVIAANTSEHLPGTLYRERPQDVVERDPRIPWVLVHPS